MKFRERPLAEMRAAGVRGEHLVPRPVPRQAAEYFSSVPVGDRIGEVSIQPLVSLHGRVFLREYLASWLGSPHARILLVPVGCGLSP
jgi:hypothetical protein